MSREHVVIGVDGGGTHTRALCVDLHGQILAAAHTDGAHPRKHPAAKENVQQALCRVLQQAGRRPEHVVQVVAGLTSVDPLKENEWATHFTEIPGLACPRHHVNDAIVAHVGAFHDRPGIIVIGGTGSIVLGINEAGRSLRNYDFGHYSGISAEVLGREAVFRILTSSLDGADLPLREHIFQHFDVQTISDLRERVVISDWQRHAERVQAYSTLAPWLVEAACHGVPIAQTICQAALNDLVCGMQLVGTMFTQQTIEYVVVGSVVQHAYIAATLQNMLATHAVKRYHCTQSAFPPVVGAVILALQQHGVPITAPLLNALRQQVNIVASSPKKQEI